MKRRFKNLKPGEMRYHGPLIKRVYYYFVNMPLPEKLFVILVAVALVVAAYSLVI